MAYEVEIVDVQPRNLVGLRRQASLSGLATAITEAFGHVYQRLQAHGVAGTGDNVIVYLSTRMEGNEMLADCFMGVEVQADVPLEEGIESYATPGGPAATTAHFGNYGGLVEAHRTLQVWCQANGRTYGVNWEAYGDWSDDPARRRTDVFYQLTA